MPPSSLSTTAPAPPSSDGTGTDEIGRRVTRRRTLPGGRAVVGALLITRAVIGVFASWLTATAAPTTSYVVVQRDLAPGAEMATGDLGLVAMTLPEEQAARAFTSLGDAVASVTLAPLEAGDLLTRSVVRPSDDVPGTSLFSFEVATSRAVAGDLSSGDRVDVLTTDDGATGYVATDIPVIDIQGEGGEVIVTVAMDDPALVLALAHASDEGQLHVALANPQRPALAGVRRNSFGEGAVDPLPSTEGDLTTIEDTASEAPTEAATGAPTEAPTGDTDAPAQPAPSPATPSPGGGG